MQHSNEVQPKACKFLEDLSKSHFESLKTLEILGFRLDYPFWISLYNLCPEGLHLAYPVSSCFDHNTNKKLKRLHLKLEENFDLRRLPFLSNRLEEFSLHFSNLTNKDNRADILWDRCVDLKKM